MLDTYRSWSREYDRERSSDAVEKNWESLAQKNQWLHWGEFVEVVKSQREEYESASTALTRAQEGVRYTVLLFYSCLPPGRSQEYRTLQFRHCCADDLRQTVPTPSERQSNLLYISHDGDQAGLYLGAFKTKKSMGAQKISLDKFDYFLRHLDRYIKKHRPRLLALHTAPEHDFLFVVRASE